jgi:hypothetical protein
MKKLLIAALTVACLIAVPACAHASASKAAAVSPAFNPAFGLGTLFGTDAPRTGNTFMLYVEIDPGLVTITNITEPGVTWDQVGSQYTLGKWFYLFHGTATKTGPETASVGLSGTYTGNVELGWQQFTGATVVAGASAYSWSGATVEFPALGTGYLWEYGKANGSASCSTASCTETPQENVLISGNFTSQPTEPASSEYPGGFSIGVRLSA